MAQAHVPDQLRQPSKRQSTEDRRPPINPQTANEGRHPYACQHKVRIKEQIESGSGWDQYREPGGRVPDRRQRISRQRHPREDGGIPQWHLMPLGDGVVHEPRARVVGDQQIGVGGARQVRKGRGLDDEVSQPQGGSRQQNQPPQACAAASSHQGVTEYRLTSPEVNTGDSTPSQVGSPSAASSRPR